MVLTHRDLWDLRMRAHAVYWRIPEETHPALNSRAFKLFCDIRQTYGTQHGADNGVALSPDQCRKYEQYQERLKTLQTDLLLVS